MQRIVSATGFFFHALIRYYYNKQASIAISDLFRKFSYRYSKEAAQSFRTPFVYLKAGLLTIIKAKKSKTIVINEICLYDNAHAFEKEDCAYLNALGIKEANYLFKDDLPNLLTFSEKCWNVLMLGLLALVLLPLSLVSRDKAKPGLIFLELAELTLLIRILKLNGAKKLYVFSAYEKEICFMSWYLSQKMDIKVFLFPSANPIKHLYRNVICDTFVFSAPFQQKECEQLKLNWYIKSTESWPPYGFQHIEIYKENLSNRKVIGFVSSGMELRKKLKHVEPYGNRDYQAEKALIKCLQLFLSRHEDFSLVIYLHPREKMETHIEFTKDYYNSLFGQNFEFAPMGLQTKSCLSLCNVSISGFSSAQFERLFGGHKTLFAPLGYLDNYFSDKVLDQISINTIEDFDSILISTINKTVDAYFEIEGLRKYRWDSYSILQKANWP